MEPINYTSQVIDPITQGLGAYDKQMQLGQAQTGLDQNQQQIDLRAQAQAFDMQQAQAQQAQAQAEAQKQATAQKAFADYIMDPNKTYEKTKAVIDQNPQIAEAVMGQWDGLQKADQEALVGFGKELTYMLSTGNVDAAKSRLESRIAAAESSGDAQEAATYKAQLQMIESGPQGVETVRGLGLASLAAVLPPEDMIKFAEMTSAGTGGLDKETFDQEKKIRDEYVKNTGDYTALKENYNKITATQDTGAGDISLIFSYMKMLDPTSVVREGEFATAANSGGIPDRVMNMYNKAMNGERLTPEQRSDFRSQAQGLMTAAQKREEEVRKGLMPTVEAYKLDPARVFSIGGDTSAPTGGNDIAMQANQKVQAEKARLGRKLTAAEIQSILTPEELAAAKAAMGQ